MPQSAHSGSPKLAELKRRLEADPASRLFLELAREYHEAGQFEEAVRVCSAGLKHHPSYLSARVLLGRIYFDMGRIEEAQSEMESVLARAPENLIARRVLAEICLEQGDVAGALDRFRALLAFNPADAETKKRIERLEWRLRSGAATEEPPPPTQAAAPAPMPAAPAPDALAPADGGGEPEAGVLATPTLAEIYVQQGLVEKATQVYHDILKGDPTNADALARLAELGAGAPAPPDPLAAARQRKIATLSGWLDKVRRAGHV